MKPGTKCVVAITCVNGNGELLYEGADDMHIQIPAWCSGDKQMTEVHLEANARQQLVVLFRRLMTDDDPNYLPAVFREAFKKNDWQVKVRVMPYPAA